MEFYLIFSNILRRPPPGKWVLLGRMAEGSSKISHLFTGVHQWLLVHFLPIKVAVHDYTELYEDTVFLR